MASVSSSPELVAKMVAARYRHWLTEHPDASHRMKVDTFDEIYEEVSESGYAQGTEDDGA